MELAPINVIYGENGSGKSSVLEALQLLKQAVGRPLRFRQHPLIQPLNFGSFRDLVFNNNEEKWISIEVWVKLTPEEIRENLVYSTPDDVSSIISPIPSEIGYKLSFRQTEEDQPVDIKQSLLARETTLVEVQQILVKGQFKSFVSVPKRISAQQPSPAGNLTQVLAENAFHFQTSTKEAEKAYNVVTRDFVRIIKRMISNYFLLRPTRATPRLVTNTSGTATWVGIEGEQVVKVLSQIFGDVSWAQCRRDVVEWASRFGLEDLHAGYVGDNLLKATFKDPVMDAKNDIAFAGHGSKQILAVLTQIFFSEPKSLIAIEEPEISLHLDLQLELPKLFAKAKHLKKQVIVTSHSGDFLTAFKSLFSKSVKQRLTRQDLAVYHLKKTLKGSAIEKLTVLADGRVKGYIPSIVKAEQKLVSRTM